MSRSDTTVTVDFGVVTAECQFPEGMTPSDKDALRDLSKGAKVAYNIGTHTGASAETILSTMDGTCISCDTYDKELQDWWSAAANPIAALNVYMARVKPFGSRAQLFVGKSLDLAALVKPESADFVFIDADHSYEGIVADIAAWRKIVKPGGILAGHDFDKRMLDWPQEKIHDYRDVGMIRENVGNDIVKGEIIHCGVFVAVKETFPDAKLWPDADSTVWWVRL